ncbi:octaheme c-type cytochrome (tetrathionate reductase family) [Methanohalophilus levihalophilus]|uniref:tetrathionate reductase family octaheme c-type cytochrome n=1 Tax=Methanohalophilus levihalophilus TaxID=1431282 RepID=UPI001AE8EC3E|nr:tetrathionate reductase family octaheme c-type cytochrome [Methanohalophilus levihalophilus]MBP2031016.1 octaheme c-type cytochrome (tetrathionate reductase family) [Methanohalophilus levihalophilus]
MKICLATGIFLILLIVAVFPASSATMTHSFLEGPYDSGPEVTEECIECHVNQANDLLNSTHWLWTSCAACGCEEEHLYDLGKRTVINNFCVAVASNEPRCTSCHAGYGWEDDTFDFTNASNLDCLVCHETTGTYTKIPTGAGAVDPSVDLVAVAQSVGSPSRETCGGNCHFFGGGGDNVKHGDMSSALLEPSADLDVHMGGLDFSCQNCHETTAHNVAGRFAGTPGSECRVECSDCHTETPHAGEYKERLDAHSDSIACQTCHIPTYAREIPTKMFWDWSKAGQDIDSIPVDEYGKATYDKKKGEFVWAMDVRPDYAWFNGSFDLYRLGDELDPDEVDVIKEPLGSREDSDSKIYPFKIHVAKQISDAQYNYLIIPDLFGGEKSYWATYDWNKAAEAGMDYVGMPYSGEYEFVETALYESINHEVAPASQALQCDDCHLEGGMDFVTLGYSGDPMIVGDQRPASSTTEDPADVPEAEATPTEATPGFSILLTSGVMLLLTLLLRRKD